MYQIVHHILLCFYFQVWADDGHNDDWRCVQPLGESNSDDLIIKVDGALYKFLLKKEKAHEMDINSMQWSSTKLVFDNNYETSKTLKAMQEMENKYDELINNLKKDIKNLPEDKYPYV
uniref:Uncharacterized protein n=1 Tax=Lactuca sativa TaxID=4236 RepID=A0A9R1UD38_LACSA|nr:hypothetical protein LSAT_V11C900506050 [Lactuca sativa]